MQIKILDPRLNDHPMTYATEGSAALDLRACIKTKLLLMPNECIIVPAGFAMNIEDPNIAALLLPRSGLGAKNGVVLGNLVGLIDSDYQGEMGIALWNRGYDAFAIKPMERVCQMVFVPVIKPALEIVEEFSVKTSRGAGGFGHTGKQ